MIRTHNIGQKIKRIFAPLDPMMVIILLLITVVSAVTMYSASTDKPVRFSRHLENLAVCWAVIVALAYTPPKLFARLAVPVYVVGVILLVAVALFGEVRLGARRWIFGFQPSELLKLGVPLMIAFYFQNSGNAQGKQLWRVFGIAVLLFAIPFLLIAKQPDLGTGLLVAAAGAYVIYFAGLSWRVIATLVGSAVVGVGVLYELLKNDVQIVEKVLHGYQLKRILVLFGLIDDAKGAGYHIANAKVAIGSGGWLGKGWMDGTQSQLQFIPEKSTDFLLAVYSEEFGLVGVILLLVLYLLLISRGLSIAHMAQTRFDRLLAGSLSMIIFTYVFVNMGMVAGILPVVGVPLPFMSYGGTALVTLGVACGMLMSIRHHRIR
ncbi:MAG: rod shape-determining protein RodA [Burkholderiaceae bacterium]|nr:rod shape-determining protein RodA [Burkholderiaceae bacterium]